MTSSLPVPTIKLRYSSACLWAALQVTVNKWSLSFSFGWHSFISTVRLKTDNDKALNFCEVLWWGNLSFLGQLFLMNNHYSKTSTYSKPPTLYLVLSTLNIWFYHNFLGKQVQEELPQYLLSIHFQQSINFSFSLVTIEKETSLLSDALDPTVSNRLTALTYRLLSTLSFLHTLPISSLPTLTTKMCSRLRHLKLCHSLPGSKPLAALQLSLLSTSENRHWDSYSALQFPFISHPDAMEVLLATSLKLYEDRQWLFPPKQCVFSVPSIVADLWKKLVFLDFLALKIVLHYWAVNWL